MAQKDSAEKAVRDIRRKTRRKFSAEEKIRIVLEGLRGEESISSLCRREGIVANLYYRWSKEFLEAGKKRLLVTPSAKPPRPKSRTFASRTLDSRKSSQRRFSKTVCSKERDGLRFCEHPVLRNWISIIGHWLLVFPLRPHSPPRPAKA